MNASYLNTLAALRRIEEKQKHKCFEILEKWFNAIEDGTVESWLPDPTEPIEISNVDKFIQMLDDEMEIDFKLSSWGQGWRQGNYMATYYAPEARKKILANKPNTPPDFKRLKSPQRLALVQELKRELLTTEGIIEEAKQRLDCPLNERAMQNFLRNEERASSFLKEKYFDEEPD
jgi:hypothetical protein